MPEESNRDDGTIWHMALFVVLVCSIDVLIHLGTRNMDKYYLSALGCLIIASMFTIAAVLRRKWFLFMGTLLFYVLFLGFALLNAVTTLQDPQKSTWRIFKATALMSFYVICCCCPCSIVNYYGCLKFKKGGVPIAPTAPVAEDLFTQTDDAVELLSIKSFKSDPILRTCISDTSKLSSSCKTAVIL